MAHSVILNWNASPDIPADSYNVYRGTATGQESTTPLNSTPLTATTYTDTTVEPGTYFYVVKSVANGVLSPVSNEASAVILPQPPTNLVVASSS